jgi:hypothetical protein
MGSLSTPGAVLDQGQTIPEKRIFKAALIASVQLLNVTAAPREIQIAQPPKLNLVPVELSSTRPGICCLAIS